MVETILDRLMKEYESTRGPLEIDFDPDWRSPCEIGKENTNKRGNPRIAWTPTKRNAFVDDFSGLEQAIETRVHDDVKKYYGRYWSSNIPLQAPDGFVELLFLWNQKDKDHLIENLIGHFLACKQANTPFSIFFACTEPSSDYFLTLNNQTGVVQLELPGQKPIREVAPSLTDFLNTLTLV